MYFTHQTLSRGVYWTQAQISCKHLPYNFRFEPDIRLCTTNFNVTSGLIHLQRLQCLVVSLKCLITKPCANLAYRLILLGVRIITRKQERPIDIRPLAFAIVGAYDGKVKRITNASQVILLKLHENFKNVSITTEDHICTCLEPVDTPFAGFVTARLRLQHLNHETLTPIFDALI